jgi:hypothetical protein
MRAKSCPEESEKLALLDSAFCDHFKASVLGAISHIAVIFCNNESRMLRCCPTEHYLPKKIFL